MSTKNKKGARKKIQNSLTALSIGLGNSMTGGSYLSSYNTQAFSNNYSLITLNRIILTYMYTGNGIFQTAVQLPIQDAIGKGIELDSGELDAEDIDKVYEYWEENGLWDKVLDFWTWVRLFGGGALLINTNQDPEKELSIDNLSNSPLEIYDLDRWQLDTNVNVFNNWETFINYEPDGEGYIYLYGEKIHESRFIRGQGKRAPHYVRRQLRGWGMSEAERMLRDLNLYMKTQDVTFEILDESKVDVYKINNLANKLLTTGGTAAIQARIQTANEIKNYVNALVLDKNEEYEQKNMGFAGLAEIMNQNRIGVAAALRMPLTKLFGLSAAGFNTGESDLENYNQFVESEIRAKLNPVVRKLLRITMSHLFGYVPSFTFAWPKLRELSAKEESEINRTKTDNILAYYDRGLMTSEEVMQESKRAGLIEVDTKAEEGLIDDFPTPPAGVQPTAEGLSNSKKRKSFFNKLFLRR
jgi:phage-related protein (TIGR01555 family)